MSDSSSDRNPIEVLAEQFVERQRRGERLTLDAFAKEYPDLEEDIRDLFPVLIKIENVRPGSGDATGPALNGTPALERIGDYRILREVGRGGMGVVYEAEQVSLGRHVALKVLPSSALLDARQVDRFSREAKAAARLHHTNIVPVYGVGEQEGLYYYVMQFIQGLGLDQVLAELRALRKGGPVAPVAGELSAISVAQSLLSGDVSSSVRLPGQPDGSSLSGTGREYWQSVARIGAQVARALGHAHHQGTLHRDIKPSNLLLDARGNVWVTDFGLAKASDSGDLTSTGEIVGTLRYIPPERFEGHSDARGDIYSLGLTLYELLTLRPAYESEERHRLLERILRDDPPAPRKLDPSIPRDLETVVLKAMSRDPARRYAKADELAEDLDSFAEDRPIQARRMSQVERFTRWCRRNPVVASLSAAVALLLVSVAVVASVGAHLANQQALRAEEAAQSEEQQRRTAEASAAENQAMLGKQLVAQGERLMDQGDLAGALVYFTEALRRDPEPTREREHRVRVGNTLRQAPRPAHVLDHGSSVREIALSPEGKRLATVGDDGKVRVWNLADGSAAGEPLDHGSPVNPRAFTPDGKRLISTGAPPLRARAQGGEEPPRPEVRVWDLATRQPARLPFRQQLLFAVQGMNTFDAALSRAVLIMEEQKAQVFDLATGTPAGPVLDAGSTIMRAGLSPDGSRVLLTIRQRTEENGRGWSSTVARLLDARTGQEIRLEGGVEEDVRSSLAFNFLPGGRLMTVQSGVATCWDAGTGKKWWTQLLDNSVFSQGISTSADGRLILLLTNAFRGSFGGSGMNQEVLDVASGRRVGVFTSGQGIRRSLSPTADRPRGASRGTPSRWWTSAPAGRGRAMRHAAPVQAARFSHDGQLLLTLAGAEMRVWDAASGEPVTPILVHEQRV
ncbi:MAG: serine/threonine-protein kinase [Gemmataceae bacterium]